MLYARQTVDPGSSLSDCEGAGARPSSHWAPNFSSDSYHSVDVPQRPTDVVSTRDRERPRGADPGWFGVSARRVLLVDDDTAILFGVSDYFRVRGYEVDSAPTLAEAKAHLDGRRYAAVIADVRLTTDLFGTEGLEVVSYARERYPGLPVVLITAHRHAHIDREARRLGVDAVFEKPLPLEVLTQTIDRLVDGKA